MTPRPSETSNTLKQVRPRPPLFRALGAEDPPALVTINGEVHRRLRIFKHDSWAASALYSAPSSLVVCKFHRRQSIGPLPMGWLGRRLARHEQRILCLLSDVENVPRWSGDVHVDGKRITIAVSHEFIPGHALGKREQVDEVFLGALLETIQAIHARDMAYVDLHKRENILVGDDGNPYLFDFQISFVQPARWPGNSWPMRALLRMFQRSDLYHVQKHFARQAVLAGRPLKSQPAPPPWIRAHRLVAKPFRLFRRWLLVRIGVRGPSGRVETEHFAEEALQSEPRKKAA